MATAVVPATASASVVPTGGQTNEYALGLTATMPAPVSAGTSAAARAAVAVLPASVDLTPYAMPAGNQGDVGSCAAWSSDYSALGYWENREGIAGGGLEPMYTYSQVTGGVDDGSYIESNLQVDETQGIDNQSDYSQGNFDYWDMPTASEKAHAVNWRLSSWTDLPVADSASGTVNQVSIETALAAGDPVVIGIPVYNNFFYVGSAANGYYAGISGAFAGNHAIAALGYNSQGLVIENSWGNGWGDDGFATLSWSFVNQYVFDAVEVGPLVDGQPANTVAPAVTGATTQGATLSVSTGTWSPAAGSYAYQWQREARGAGTWTAIAGATAATYTTAGADAGASLRVLVTATNTRGSGTAISTQAGPITAPLPVNTVAPTVTGTPTESLTLTATEGTWSPAGTSYAYQWQRSYDGGRTWVSVWGMTGSTYQLEESDVGNYVRAQVAATNAGGTTYAWTVVGPIKVGTPVDSVAPSITGTASRGSTLTAVPGTWTPAATSYTYQWQSSANGTTWTNISGATGATYVPATSVESDRVRVIVTAVNPFGSAGATSAATAAVARSAPAVTAAPVVSGNAKVGSVLTATSGTWSGLGNAYAYQWQRSSNGTTWTAIAGATGATYTPATADLNDAVRVVVTATNPDAGASDPSAATAKVAAASAVKTALKDAVKAARKPRRAAIRRHLRR
jgi:hypothetical protein